jgi:hypothetical protein
MNAVCLARSRTTESDTTSEVKATVPVLSGKVIVLSAVGSTTVSVVSKSSGVEPSNITLVVTCGVSRKVSTSVAKLRKSV